MKQIILAVLIALFTHQAKAQPLLNADASGTTCTDLEMRIYTWDLSNPCVITGISNPIPVVAGTPTLYDYNAIATGVGWSLDPGPWVLGTNDWHFAAVDIFNCNAPSSSMGGPCLYYDGATVGNHACLAYTSTSCFEYSTSCSSCSMGKVVNLHFGAGSLSTLQIN